MSNKTNLDHSGFKNLGIKPSILAVLAKIGLENPTPIQTKAIPVAISGKDLIGIAQTGTGKTLAFGVPLIQRLAEVKGRALVLLPTRELAAQVEESLGKLGKDLGLRTVSIIGGEAVNRQLFALRRNPHVFVATPGRLMDHVKRRSISLHDISVLVLDEADMMFDMGFAPQIEEIIKLTPKNRQTLLFSATMPAPIIRLAEKYLSSPLQIEVAPAGSTAELVDQEIYLIRSEDRFTTLEQILSKYKNLVLIFVRTKYGAANLTKKLRSGGHQANEIHSNLSFQQRKNALAGFRNGTQRILVATDVAARGLDINDIELVVNFDLPDNSEDYVHRIGRTARAGKGGKAISFALPNQRRDVQKIERLIKKNLPLTKIGEVQGEIKREAMVAVPRNNIVRGRGRFQNRSQSTARPQARFQGRPKFQSRPQSQDSRPILRPKSAPDFSILSAEERPKPNFSARPNNSDRFDKTARPFKNFSSKPKFSSGKRPERKEVLSEIDFRNKPFSPKKSFTGAKKFSSNFSSNNKKEKTDDYGFKQKSAGDYKTFSKYKSNPAKPKRKFGR